MDIGLWLREQGFSQYEALFSDNAVDYDVLPELAESDLEKLGIPLGHRKRLIKAIARIGETPAETAPPPPPAPLPTPGKDEAERRPITVMFCDLVGSTSLSSKLDAEDWRELVGAYLDEASRAVTGFGGHVLKKLGDGLMALFGYPQAQENDAERAARAGLAIFRALDELNAKNVARGLPALAARIGLESGPVVVDQTGEVFGDAPNVAARVQSAAEPGTLLVTAGVQRQVAGLFVVEDKGPHELKGVAGKPNLYRIVRASGGGRRLGARSLTPLVGRADELALLLRRWQRAREGEGQLLQIVGEPGLGKSRLMEEFRSGIAEAPHTWVEWSSSQLLQNTPLHPVAEWGRQRFGGADVPAAQRLSDLDATLAQVKLDPGEHTPLIAPLLDIPVPETRAAKLAPEEMRRRQLAAIVAWLLAGARTQPLALAFEDLHWADPTSLDLMKTLAERGAQAPMMIVATARPEFRAPWTTRSHHGVISLIPLDRAQIRKMVSTLAERHALSKETVEGLADRTGGVPLFVEEVTRLMLEGGAQTIPPTLQQSLAARLDRLGEAREVAQIGAVLGREFSYGLLQAVAGLPEPALRSSLEKLVEADLLYAEGSPPSAIYRFKHALIQDAAYDSLLKNRRQALHRRAAEALVKNPEPQPELVAHHFTQSGQTEPAIEWWGKAGDAALRRSAFQEAISHLGRAIEMADKEGGVAQGKSSASASRRVQFHADLSQATMLAKGYTAPETKAAFARLEEVSRGSGAVHPNFAEFYARWVVDLMQGRHAKARQTAQQFLQAALGEDSSSNIAAARRALGWSCFALGELGPALSEYEAALGLLPENAEDQSRFQFGMDTRGSAEIYRACACLIVGDMQTARLAKANGFTRAEAINHVPTSVNVYLFAASASTLRRDAVAAEAEARRVIELSQSHGLPQYLAYAEICLGWALARLGSPEAGLTMLRGAIADQEAQGSLYWRPWYLGLLAELELDATDPAAAGEICDSALATAGRTGEAWCDAALRALRGDILIRLDPGNITAAEDAYLEALRIARAQGARTFELQAARSLARLYQSTNRPLEAHDALAPALEGFAPTPEFPAIAEAQALLATLAETPEVKEAKGKRLSQAELYANYTRALSLGKGYGHAETGAAAARAREASGASSQAHFDSLFLQTITRLTSGEAAAASHTAETMLREAEAEGFASERRTGLRVLGLTRLFQGRLADADAMLTRALAGGERDDEAKDRLRFLHDHESFTLAVLAVVSWLRGEFVSALAAAERARAAADALRHPPTSGLVLVYRSMLDARRGEFDALVEDCEALRQLGVEYGMPQYLPLCDLNILWARARGDGDAETVDTLRKGFLRATEIWKHSFPFSLALLAEAELGAGQPEAALASAERALAFAADSGIGCEVAWLHRLRGDALLRADPVAAATAYAQAVEIAKAQGARTFQLQAALALAKLNRSTNRPLEAHDILAPALEGFAPTPEFPAIAEAQALLAELEKTEAVAAHLRQRETRAKLHSGFALANMMTKGFSAGETQAALTRAGAYSEGTRIPQYWTLQYGRISTDMMRGEAAAARAGAEAFIAEAEARGLKGHAAYGRRTLGFLKLMAGDFVGASAEVRRVLAEAGDGADPELQAIFGTDLKSYAESLLAHPIWYLGEFDEAARLCESAFRHASETGLPGSQAPALFMPIVFAARRGDAQRTLPIAEKLLALAETHKLDYWRAVATNFLHWARGRLGQADSAEALRAARFADSDPSAKLGQAWNWALLADLETALGRPEAARAAAETGLAKAAESGEDWIRTWLLRLRGDALAGHDPAGAEAAYREALDVAARQGARADGLLTSLALAKLHQTNNRLVDAHDLLGAALEGFAPTPAFPAIAEAQALLAALAADATVASHLRQRETRAKLHSGFALATMMTRGFASEDTRAALARAEAAAGTARTPEYWSVWYARINAEQARGDLRSARASAEAFLAEAEANGLKGHAAFARLRLGFCKYIAGELAAARRDDERALADYREGNDAILRATFSVDLMSSALNELAGVAFYQGEFEEAERLIDAAMTRAKDKGPPISHVYALFTRIVLCALSGRDLAGQSDIVELRSLAEALGLKFYTAMATSLELWTCARHGEPTADAFRASLGAFEGLGARLVDVWLLGWLSEVELAAGRRAEALAALQRGFALVDEMGYELGRPWFLLLRGDALADSDPAGAVSAYREAIEIARTQGARPAALLAALRLAQRLRSNAETVEAHATLSEALAGLAPTPLFPAIAEAQALLAELADDETVAAELRRRETRAKLHSGYALASMMTKGFAADETRAALARAETVAGTARTPEYWRLLYGRISAAMAAADFATARAGAETFLREAEALGLPGHATFARRLIGFQKTIAGDFPGAAADLRGALAETDAERDAHLSELFGMDLVSTAMAACAQAIWYLGEFDESHRLTEAALAHAKQIGKPSSWLHANVTRIIVGLVADRPDVVLPFAEEAGVVAARHDLKYWSVAGPFWADWARVRLGQPRSGDFRDHFAAIQAMGVKLGLPMMWTALADVERAAGRTGEALEAYERALEGGAGQSETRTWQLRLRADLLAHSDPAAAEAGYGEALRLAGEQGSPVLALLAALSLAKFLAGRGRALEAHDTLAPALEGFAPTPHLPAIAEAQALLAVLAADETVAAQLRQRQVRAKLHSGFALATMMTKGFAADETKAALARAEKVAETARTPQYWTVLYGRVGAALSAADLPAARAAAEAFLAEAESLGLKGHAAFARRAIGFQKLIPGDFRGAAADLRRALAETDEQRDAPLSDLFGMDVVATAKAACAQAIWYLGEFDEAARLTEAALAHAKQSGRPVSWLHANANRLFYGLQTGQPDVVLAFAEQARTLAEEHDLKYWKFGGAAWADWARARLGLPLSRDFSGHLEAGREMGVKLGLSLFHGMHADVELAAGRKREAIEAVERALDHSAAKGEREWTAWLLRVRAAALAEGDPQAAEASFRDALGVAQQQGSPTLALISALALAKFLAGRGRGLEAHDALSPALEGLAPTPHLPAIAEAHRLMAELRERR